MNEPGLGTDDAANASLELASLQSRVEAVRTVLTGLLQDVVVAEAQLGSSQVAQLVEANEQLVLAAMRHQVEAETASQALSEAGRSGEFDALTDLPNRVLFRDRLARALIEAKRHGTSLAVLFLDLNNFKSVNDTLSHAIGDQVLQWVGACLTASVREADTVSRYGGDEFLVLLPQVGHAIDALRVAEKAIATLAAPRRFAEHVLRLHASIGISVYPEDGQSVDELIDRADGAMYQAKSQGPGSFAFHPGPNHLEPLTRAPLESLQHPLTESGSALAEHELRYAQLREAATSMLGRLKTDEPRLPRAKGLIDRHVTQISHLIDDLLDVSRVKTGKLNIQPELIDALDVIDDAILSCRPAMDTRLQSLDIRLPNHGLMMRGDRGRLVQVLQNLLNNASKFTPHEGAIGIHALVEGSTLAIAVFDDGIGITPELLPQIFEPFVQDAHALGINEVGLGVGLTVARQLALAHGGSIDASSEGRGRGSRFVLRLPLLHDN